jgi:hypothetical protein
MLLSFTGGYICLLYINTKHIERRRERSIFYVLRKNVKQCGMCIGQGGMAFGNGNTNMNSQLGNSQQDLGKSIWLRLEVIDRSIVLEAVIPKGSIIIIQ